MKRLGWIDFARGIAIIAVILDHVFLIFPVFYRQVVWQHMMFNILWFVVLSGVTNGLSAMKRPLNTIRKVIRFWVLRCAAILIPYFIASVIYYLTLYHKTHTLSEFLFLLFNFRTKELFYFVHLILQLYLIFPILFYFAKRIPMRWQGIIILLLTYITVVFYPVKVPPWKILLGQDFFARSYLSLFYLGILMALYGGLKQWWYKLGLFALFAYMEYYNITTYFSQVGGIPTVVWILWSVSGLLLAKEMYVFIPHNIFIDILKYFGRQSMFIYLFHYIVLALIYENIKPVSNVLDFIAIVGCSIIVSLAIQMFYTRVKTKMAYLFNFSKNDRLSNEK